MKIVFLLPVHSDAHCLGRVSALQTLGVESQLLAFERDYYPGRLWPGGYRSLGRIQHGNYFKRLPALLKALSVVRSTARSSDVIYAFGLDMLLTAWFATRGLKRKVALVYEVSDIRVLLIGDSAISKLLRWLERYLLQHVVCVIVTSEAYVTGYFHKIQGMYNVNYQVIENKLESSKLSPISDDNKTSNLYTNSVLRIGYFGLIRCRYSWVVLKSLVKRANGRIRVYIRGVLWRLGELEEEIQNTEFVEYRGPYISPDDLPTMYNQVDLIWAAHHHGETNTRWARANRFYEACYFKRPMIAQEGTQDGKVVSELELGINIDLLDVERSVEELLSVDKQMIDTWWQNLASLPINMYVYTDEHKKLLKILQANLERNNLPRRS
jgi:succinoglycan biosynthesis protein ExoL